METVFCSVSDAGKFLIIGSRCGTEQYKYCGISCRLETIFAKGIPRNQRSGFGANV